ncbi:MAG: hypothetical protein JO263_02390, partial [Candidatus Eremiobacteraeota bacterium]|nr:hypothetical protein [Candidatus Eremiobacteraeota bacterium]
MSIERSPSRNPRLDRVGLQFGPRCRSSRSVAWTSGNEPTYNSLVAPDIFETLKPKLASVLQEYSRKELASDAIAGVTVGLVALPLAMAFGIASGVTPQAGIYTAIVGGLIVALLGGSRVQVAGPTGAFVVIVAGIIARHGLSGILVVTMMAGIILVFLGITGLGNAVKFIPRPVVVGFTNGIAILIASTQIKDALGLKLAANPSEFFARMQLIGTHIGAINGSAVLIAALAVAVLLLMPRVAPRMPAAIVAVVVATVLALGLHLPIETIGSRFGAIPAGLPHLDIPPVRPDLILPLLPSALTVAILAAV